MLSATLSGLRAVMASSWRIEVCLDNGLKYRSYPEYPGVSAPGRYFEVAANWRTVLMKVLVARVRVRSRR